MTTQTEATQRYAATIDRLATAAEQTIAGLFDRVAPWTVADSNRFHEAAQPHLAATAQASVNTSSAYATTIADTPANVSPDLIVADAAARTYVPFDRLAHLLAEGVTFADAITSAREVASQIGRDAAYSPARQSLAYLAPATSWVRRVHPQCCEWCLGFVGVEFGSAAQASFGHDNDRCLVVPADPATVNRNRQITDDRGYNTPQAQLERRTHDQRISLQRQIATAKKHQRAAHDQIPTETDPARRTRLEYREQEWETRAEAAAEQLRILMTGTHKLPGM